MKTLTKIFEFDAAHRVMHERIKCFNLHGHRFKVELTFEFKEVSALGYAIDFKEIKRVAGTFIDKYLDHSCVLNPDDKELVKLCADNGWRYWIMGMGAEGDINPSAENIANELLYILRYLFQHSGHGINLTSIKFYETPTCWVEVDEITYAANSNFFPFLDAFAKNIGVFEYDDRKVR